MKGIKVFEIYAVTETDITKKSIEMKRAVNPLYTEKRRDLKEPATSRIP